MNEHDKDLVNKVIQIVAQIAEMPVSKVSVDADLPNQLGINSMMGLEVMYAIEKEFKLHLNENDLQKMKTIRAICDLIAKPER